MKKIVKLSFLLLSLVVELTAQVPQFDSLKDQIVNLGTVTENDEDFSSFSNLDALLTDVEIVMLGEQSHGEATTYQTKIKLIKYLHQKMGFDLLVFESGFYDCQKAWQLIREGMDFREAMGRSVFDIWSTTKEFKPLADYLETVNKTSDNLKVLGFDSQFTGRISEKYFMQDLTAYVNSIDPSFTTSKEWKHLEENFNYLTSLEFKKLKKNNPEQDTLVLNTLMKKFEEIDTVSSFWIQCLKNAKLYLSDASLGSDYRDKQMAKNLIWIKQQHPNSKIICWGATSHFLYNSTVVRMKNPVIQLLAGNYYKKHPMMGTYIKNHYKDKVYTIGFTAYQGMFGLFRRKKIKPAKSGTFEALLNESEHDNFLLSLAGLDFSNHDARPLGNYYMKNDICEVMDAVIFNRYMERPDLDNNFFLQIYPENKYIKPEAEN